VKAIIRVFVGLELLFAATLLTYCILMLLRLAMGGDGRVGGDVIAAAYVLGALSVISGLTAIWLSKDNWRPGLMRRTHIFCLVAVLVWSLVHISGVVYSHASLFA
jgi:hypothetical protein